LLVKAKAEERPTGGIKVRTNGEVALITFKRILEELERLEKPKTCETCSCIDFGKDEKAQCHPKNYSSYRKKADFCHFHSPRL
jgi:hypothetical protein